MCPCFGTGMKDTRLHLQHDMDQLKIFWWLLVMLLKLGNRLCGAHRWKQKICGHTLEQAEGMSS